MVDSDGYTALHMASKFGHSQCLQLLLNAGVNVDTLSSAKE